MNRVTAIRNRKNESGQVLLLAVIAMILVLIATLLLFDVHTVIRGKVKAQNGVDAAAMTAAEWQKHSLNVIGDLNLARATCTLLSNPYFGVGVLDNPGLKYDDIFSRVRKHDMALPFVNPNHFTSFPRQLWDFLTDPESPIPEEERMKMLMNELARVESEKQYLIVIDELISQLQTRLSFIGPMIAFGAAQQAAKNNGLRYDEKAGATYNMYRTILLERLDPVYKEAFDIQHYDEDEYEDEEGQSSTTILPDEINGFYWPLSYIPMLDSIFALVEVQTNKGRQMQARGIAAGTSFTFSGMPRLIANSWTKMWYLGRSETYHNILTENWRAIEWLLRDCKSRCSSQAWKQGH